MKTMIYHITYYDFNKSVYIQFASCNFRCVGCIRKLYRWDHHLDEADQKKLPLNTDTLAIDEFEKLVEKLKSSVGLERACLGGGEPTVDPSFCSIVDVLRKHNIHIAILTNGYLIDKVISCIPKKALIELSIKSIDPKKFEWYTGRDLETVIKNFKLLVDEGRRVVVETILIPGFNDAEDIGELAKFVADLDRSIPMIIDEYVPVPQAPWRRPTVDELRKAYECARRHLDMVIVRSSYPEFFTSRRLGKTYVVYPYPRG